MVAVRKLVNAARRGVKKRKEQQQQQQVGAFKQSLGDTNNQTLVSGPKVLTSQEQATILKTMPEGTILDQFGNVVQKANATPQEKAARRSEGIKKASGSTTDTQILQERARTENIQQALGQAQQQVLTPEELLTPNQNNFIPNPIEIAGTSGLGIAGTSVARNVLGGATTSGTASATAGNVAGAAFLVASIANIRAQRTREFAKNKKALSSGEKQLKAIIANQNLNPQNYEQNIEDFYRIKNAINSAHARTWRANQNDIDQFIKNGEEDLINFELYQQNRADFLEIQFLQSLQNPDPNLGLNMANQLQINDQQETIE